MMLKCNFGSGNFSHVQIRGAINFKTCPRVLGREGQRIQ